MESTHTRSPTTPTARSRPPLPHGPRSPKLVPKSPTGIPLDLCSRLDEATPAYYSPRSSSSSPFSAASPLYQDAASGFYLSRPSKSSKAVQTSVEERVVVASAPAASPAVKVIKKPPTLTPPPPLQFESVPVSWRGMTLEAAHWSLTSEQLQEIVSGAIRKSAQESFIRLVPLKTLDEELVQELERLDSLKAMTQSQYRFNMHRRTMLLQSLNALSFTHSSDTADAEALANLTTQLAEVTVSCDRLMETLLTISDQRAQIQRLQDVHIASALAMALRKLNASYGRRAAELKKAQAKIVELQAELEEAWQVAEEMAQEMDDLDNFDFGSFDDEEPPVVVGDRFTETSMEVTHIAGVSGTALGMKATCTSVPGDQTQVADRASRVSAARKRSTRASKASLRLPKTSSDAAVDQSLMAARRSRSRSRSKIIRRPSANTGSNVQVPAIQIEGPACRSDSFLEMAETRPPTPTPTLSHTQEAPPPLPQTSHFTSRSHRDTLDVPAPPPDTPSNPQPSPGFDRTMIPPPTVQDAKVGSRYTTIHQDRQLPARRVQSLQPRSRSSPLAVSLKSADRRSRSDDRLLDWSLTDSMKPRRYSIPFRARTVECPRTALAQAVAPPGRISEHAMTRSNT